MKDTYIKSLQMIKFLGIRITRKQYNQLAKKFNLLSSTSLQYMSQKSFNYLIKNTISSI